MNWSDRKSVCEFHGPVQFHSCPIAIISLQYSILYSAIYSFQPPVGVSQDSDSEVEEFIRIIKESHIQLQSTQAALKQRQQHLGSSYLDLLSTCEKNIKRLEDITKIRRHAMGPLESLSERKVSGKEVHDFGDVQGKLSCLYLNGIGLQFVE